MGHDGSPRTPVPVAILGVGSTGRAYADALVDHPDLQLVAAVDPVVERARHVLAGNETVHALRSVHDLLDAAPSLGLRAAIVCSPTLTHVPSVTVLLDRGIGVLCHPPLAPSRPSARMVIDTARRSRAPLIVALDHRRADEVSAAADLVATGALGDIRLVRVHLRNSQPAEHGILRELGTIGLDLVRALIGPILHVTADATDVSDARTSTAQLLVRAAGELTASVVLSADSALAPGWEVLIEGSDGALRLDLDGLSRYRGLGWEAVCGPTPTAELRHRHLRDFAAALETGAASSAFDDANTLAAVAVLEAARRSVETGGWARVLSDHLVTRP
jgi:predicted dehydrogenase